MLTRYIRDLLFREERIVIPDFGTLLSEQVSATIDSNQNIFYPPTKKLIFDSNTVENDGLLAQYIASVDKISYESAVNFIKFEVGNWLEKLQTEDLILPDLGTFSKDLNDKIVFEPHSKSNFLTTSFGLSDVTTGFVQRTPLDLHPIEITDENVIEIAHNQEVRGRKRKPKSKSSWLNFAQYAAIFIALLGLGWVLMREIIKNNDMVKNVNELKATQDAYIDQHLQEAVFELQKPLKPLTLRVKIAVDSLTINYQELDSLKLKTQTNLLSPVTTSTLPKNDTEKLKTASSNTETKSVEPAEPTDNPAVQTSKAERYHVIAGSFKGGVNAIEKIKELRSKGYKNAVILDKVRDLHQVSYGSYATEQEARMVLESIKDETPDAWILPK